MRAEPGLRVSDPVPSLDQAPAVPQMPSRGATLGVIMQMGGSLRDYQRSGQLDNLLHYHLAAYLRVFDRIFFFSYENERIEDYTDDPFFRSRVTVLPKRVRIPDRFYALLLPLVYRRETRQCAVFRVLQATGALPTIVARALFGVPYVTTFGYRYAEFARIERSRLKAISVSMFERMAVRWADAVIVTTDAIRRHIASVDGASRTVMIPNGVDTRLFVAAERGGGGHDPDRTPNVLFVGRLERQKNLDVLVEAMGIVRRRQPIRLTVVGDGSLPGPCSPPRRCCGRDGGLRWRGAERQAADVLPGGRRLRPALPGGRSSEGPARGHELRSTVRGLELRGQSLRG